MAKDLPTLKRSITQFSRARRWRKYHTPKNLAMAMSVEASEVVELFQWLTPKEAARLTPKQREALSDELADTYIYLLRLAEVTRIDLIKAAFKKMKKNAVKYPVSRTRL